MILSSARRRALEVLAETHPAALSVTNVTASTVGGNWLIKTGLAEFHPRSNEVTLTRAGLLACKAAGITVGRAA